MTNDLIKSEDTNENGNEKRNLEVKYDESDQPETEFENYLSFIKNSLKLVTEQIKQVQNLNNNHLELLYDFNKEVVTVLESCIKSIKPPTITELNSSSSKENEYSLSVSPSVKTNTDKLFDGNEESNQAISENSLIENENSFHPRSNFGNIVLNQDDETSFDFEFDFENFSFRSHTPDKSIDEQEHTPRTSNINISPYLNNKFGVPTSINVETPFFATKFKNNENSRGNNKIIEGNDEETSRSLMDNESIIDNTIDITQDQVNNDKNNFTYIAEKQQVNEFVGDDVIIDQIKKGSISFNIPALRPSSSKGTIFGVRTNNNTLLDNKSSDSINSEFGDLQILDSIKYDQTELDIGDKELDPFAITSVNSGQNKDKNEKKGSQNEKNTSVKENQLNQLESKMMAAEDRRKAIQEERVKKAMITTEERVKKAREKKNQEAETLKKKIEEKEKKVAQLREEQIELVKEKARESITLVQSSSNVNTQMGSYNQNSIINNDIIETHHKQPIESITVQQKDETEIRMFNNTLDAIKFDQKSIEKSDIIWRIEIPIVFDRNITFTNSFYRHQSDNCVIFFNQTQSKPNGSNTECHLFTNEILQNFNLLANLFENSITEINMQPFSSLDILTSSTKKDIKRRNKLITSVKENSKTFYNKILNITKLLSSVDKHSSQNINKERKEENYINTIYLYILADILKFNILSLMSKNHPNINNNMMQKKNEKFKENEMQLIDFSQMQNKIATINPGNLTNLIENAPPYQHSKHNGVKNQTGNILSSSIANQPIANSQNEATNNINLLNNISQEQINFINSINESYKSRKNYYIVVFSEYEGFSLNVGDITSGELNRNNNQKRTPISSRSSSTTQQNSRRGTPTNIKSQSSKKLSTTFDENIININLESRDTCYLSCYQILHDLRFLHHLVMYSLEFADFSVMYTFFLSMPLIIKRIKHSISLYKTIAFITNESCKKYALVIANMLKLILMQAYFSIMLYTRFSPFYLSSDVPEYASYIGSTLNGISNDLNGDIVIRPGLPQEGLVYSLLHIISWGENQINEIKKNFVENISLDNSILKCILSDYYIRSSMIQRLTMPFLPTYRGIEAIKQNSLAAKSINSNFLTKLTPLSLYFYDILAGVKSAIRFISWSLPYIRPYELSNILISGKDLISNQSVSESTSEIYDDLKDFQNEKINQYEKNFIDENLERNTKIKEIPNESTIPINMHVFSAMVYSLFATMTEIALSPISTNLNENIIPENQTNVRLFTNQSRSLNIMCSECQSILNDILVTIIYTLRYHRNSLCIVLAYYPSFTNIKSELYHILSTLSTPGIIFEYSYGQSQISIPPRPQVTKNLKPLQIVYTSQEFYGAIIYDETNLFIPNYLEKINLIATNTYDIENEIFWLLPSTEISDKLPPITQCDKDSLKSLSDLINTQDDMLEFPPPENKDSIIQIIPDFMYFDFLSLSQGKFIICNPHDHPTLAPILSYNSLKALGLIGFNLTHLLALAFIRDSWLDNITIIKETSCVGNIIVPLKEFIRSSPIELAANPLINKCILLPLYMTVYCANAEIFKLLEQDIPKQTVENYIKQIITRKDNDNTYHQFTPNKK